MKNIKNLKTGVFVLGAMFLINIMACDITGLQDSIDNFALVIALEEINTGSSILFTDATTGELINTTVNVSFEGQNGSDVIDMFSDPITEVEVEESIVVFGIDNSVIPTIENPATIKLRLEADGYLPVVKTVEITDTGISDFNLTMVNENDKPEGIKDISASATTNTDGTLASDLEVMSGDTTTATFNSRITIPEGTVFEDANGNTLTGNITAEMTYYDPSESSALDNLPFDADLFSSDVNSVTMFLGVSSITVTDQQGKIASKMYSYGKNKEKLVTPALTLVNSVITDVDLSGAVISVPDENGLTTINSSTTCSSGRCTTVSSDISLAKKPAKGQSMKNLDSQTIIAITVTLPVIPPAFKTYNQLIINHNGWTGNLGYYYRASGQNAESENAVRLSEGADQTTLSTSLKFFDDAGKKNFIIVSRPVQQSYEFSTPLPSGNTLTISLPQRPAGNYIDTTIDVELKCTNPDEKLSLTSIPLIGSWYRKAGDDAWASTSRPTWNYDKEEQELKGGSITLRSTLQGADYELWIHYDGKSEKRIINISGTTIKITISESIDSYCS